MSQADTAELQIRRAECERLKQQRDELLLAQKASEQTITDLRHQNEQLNRNLSLASAERDELRVALAKAERRAQS